MAVSWFIETWGAVKSAYKMQVYYFCGVHSFREYINLKIRKAGCMIKKRIWKSYLFGFVIYMSTGNSLHPVRIVDLRERKG